MILLYNYINNIIIFKLLSPYSDGERNVMPADILDLNSYEIYRIMLENVRCILR